MIVLVRPVFVGVIRGVMVIEHEDFILLVISRKHVGGIAVVALGQLLEKTETAGDVVILSTRENPDSAAGQFKKPFAPFALRDGAVNGGNDDNDHRCNKQEGNHILACRRSKPKPRFRPLQFQTAFGTTRHPVFAFPFSVRRHLCGVELSAAEIRHAVRAALAEDIGGGDATTLATVPANATAKAVMRAREPLVVAGIEFAETAFRELSPKIKIKESFARRPARRKPARRC